MYYLLVTAKNVHQPGLGKMFLKFNCSHFGIKWSLTTFLSKNYF